MSTLHSCPVDQASAAAGIGEYEFREPAGRIIFRIRVVADVSVGLLSIRLDYASAIAVLAVDAGRAWRAAVKALVKNVLEAPDFLATEQMTARDGRSLTALINFSPDNFPAPATVGGVVACYARDFTANLAKPEPPIRVRWPALEEE